MIAHPNSTVSRDQKFSPDNPCPICGGHVRIAKGRGERCWGFLSSDGEYAHCTREEFAGNLSVYKDGTFVHRLAGPCHCGTEHGPAKPGPKLLSVPDRSERKAKLVSKTVYRIRDPETGDVVAQHPREEYDDGSKKFFWLRPNGEWGLNGTPVASLPLYRAFDLHLFPNDPVVMGEGEKPADALHEAGVLGLGTVTGAKETPDVEVFRPLIGRDVYLWPDNDDDGESHMQRIAERLHSLGIAPRRIVWPDAPPKGDAADFLKVHTLDDLEDLINAAEPYQFPPSQADPDVTLDDFYADMVSHQYIYTPSRDLWPAASVNGRLGRVPFGSKTIAASAWLDRNRPVEQMTWVPGLPTLIHDRLVSQGGWLDHPGATVFNSYLPPTIQHGDTNQADRWLDHVHRVYPNDAEHILDWLAHRVQRPGEKINHAIVLGGTQGIGKDTLLEPVAAAVGPWNVADVSPVQLLGRFNSFAKSVILRVSEIRDLGESDRGINRFSFYEHTKAYTAAPPDVLRCDQKNRQEINIPNVCGVVITTNHLTDGLYLPETDRRHYVAWSECTPDDFESGYWESLYAWYESGGNAHVAAYLASRDLSTFNPKAPPRKTAAFWSIVDAGRAPEDSELADVLESRYWPEAIVLSELIAHAPDDLASWLQDRRNSRQIPHRMEAAGYVKVRNDTAKDGQFRVAGKRQAVYVNTEKCPSERERIAAARELAEMTW